MGLRTRNLAAFVLMTSAACTGLIGDGDDVPDEGTTSVTADGLGATPLRRLTRAHYDHSIRDLLGIDASYASAFSPDEKVGAFHSNAIAPVTELDVESYMEIAETIAAVAVDDLDALLPCAPSEGAACGDAFIAGIGPRAYRRPLSELELEQLRGVFAVGSETDFASGIRLVVQTLLQSPHFLYHVEPTTQDGAPALLDGYALASRLSYFLWSSMPDDALLAAADAGELANVEQIQAQAERMLADDKADATITSFHRQWLRLDDFDQLVKDPAVFPEFDDVMRAAMIEETDQFVSHVMRHDDGRLSTLLTADYSFPGEALVELYGIDAAASGEPISLDPNERSGLLTQASVLAIHSHGNQTSPVDRGVMVRENLLCQPLPTPPENVNNTPPDPDPELTTRDRFAQHVADPSCAACHKLIDGIGFGFEGYDALGRFRDMENGKPVDASGDITSAPGIEGAFDGVVELSQILSESELVRRCVSKQWFRYAFGRIEDDVDAKQLDVIYEGFAASDFDIRQLILAIVTSDAFRHRLDPSDDTEVTP
jgi:Protein of unknown function (DUF1592)/Protein of unknown function (DUF1588)/Protein of unknown function (DUF1585)/Protein of unknown function (DUF1595)/Protein of unknown function (DUF1587)